MRSDCPVAEPSFLSPLERIARQPLMLGLFLPLQSGGWNASNAERTTDWSFDYNACCATRAEELGFDLVFGLAQWLGKDGYGGEMRFRAEAMDPLMVSAGLASITKRLILISTIHVLYGWHPLQIAKLGATIDNMSGGRWGLNVVTGYKRSEFEMFGLPPIEHDQRYRMAEEFALMLRRLWSEPENLSVEGEFWRMSEAFVAPKPVHGQCIMVSAGSSRAGIEYAARHSDLIFITSPAGPDPEKACASLPAHIADIKDQAKRSARKLKTLINPIVICRDTEREALAERERILAGEDALAIDNFYRSFQVGDQTSWKAFDRASYVLGGNLHLVGTPERIVDWFVRLHAAGCDGVQICFFDFLPELEYFGANVLPLLSEAGLRVA